MQTRALRAVLAALVAAGTAISLTACAPSWPQADWSQSTGLSKSQVLRFVASADCHAGWGFNPIKGGLVYAVIAMTPVGTRTYRIMYQGPGGLTTSTLYVSQWWKPGVTDAQPLAWSDDRSCALLVDVPRSVASARPYFVPQDPALAQEIERAKYAKYFLVVLAGFFAILLGGAWFGVEHQATWWAALGWTVALVVGGAIAAAAVIDLPVQRYEEAQEYWHWFNELPTFAGHLLPLSVQQFFFLLQGPPNDLQPHELPWMLGVGLASALLVVPLSVFFQRGLYWLCTPLALEAAFKRALREGRAPTTEELDQALVAALSGKAAWQINIMRRKAQAFARRFR